jgi:hypothetical protein
VSLAHYPGRALFSKHLLDPLCVRWRNARQIAPFAYAPDGRLALVSSSNTLEIRAAESPATVLAASDLPRDVFGAASCATWSADGTLVAIASSTGKIYLFSDSLRRSATYSSNPLHASGLIDEDGSTDYAAAFATLAFVPQKPWLVALQFTGSLHVLSADLDGLSVLHTLTLGLAIRTLNAAVFLPAHALLLVAVSETAANTPCIRSWRLVHESPFFVPSDVAFTCSKGEETQSPTPICSLSATAAADR